MPKLGALLGKLLMAGLVLAVIAFIVTRYGNAREESGRASERLIQQEANRKTEHAASIRALADKDQLIAAITHWGERAAALEPIVIRATDKVTEYAKSPEGARACLSAERVRSIEEDRTALSAAAASNPSQGAGALPLSAVDAIRRR